MITATHWECMPISATLVQNGVSKLELALELFSRLNIPPNVILTVIADGWYTKRPLVTGLRCLKIHYIGKVRRDAELYSPLSPDYKRPKGKRGPYRKRGEQVYLESLTRKKPDIESESVIIRGKKRCVDIWSAIVLVPRWDYMKTRAIVVRWKVRSGNIKHLFLLCTDLTLPLLEIVQAYDARWMIETCFCDLKQRGGFASYSGLKARGHRAWAQLCCVARTLLILLNRKKRAAYIDPWRRFNQPEYTTVGQKRLELTMLLSHFAQLGQKASISGDPESIKCQRTKNR